MIRIKHTLLVVLGLLFLGIGVAGIVPSIASAGTTEVQVCSAGDPCDTFINKYIEPFIVLLTISVGILAAISIVVAGIQYASAGDDPGKVQSAKERIWKTLIGLFAYIFLFAFLNYIVPGGLI